MNATRRNGARRAALGAGAALALAVLVGASDRAVAGEEATATIESARWENGYGVKFYNVVGSVANQSQKPLGAVRVRIELLGADGKVVKSADAWNASAEQLADASGDAARKKLGEIHAKPIAPGGQDKFRMSFLEDETPKFEKQQAHVVATLPAQ
jgi:hypothetical protein